MTLCLAQSLIDNKGRFIAQDQLRRYVRWYREGYLSSTGSCFDIGGATRIALATWNEFFNRLPADTDVLDPDVHMPGQARIDQALKRKVSVYPLIQATHFRAEILFGLFICSYPLSILDLLIERVAAASPFADLGLTLPS